MNQLLKCLIVLTFVSSAISLDFGQFLGFQREAREEPPKDPEIPEVVETVRWRQSVCVVPGPNVPPCFSSLKKYQNEHDKNSERRIDENVGESTNEEKLDRKTGRALSLERDDLDVSRMITPKVMRLMEVENSPSDQVQSFDDKENLRLNIRSATPGLEVAYGRRQGKYLIIATGSPTASPSTPPPVISVTKVLNSPVTATLVAKNCFPDIGVPLCNDYQETLTIYKKPKLESKRDSVGKNYRHRDHHSHHRGRERYSQMDENEDSFLHNSQVLLDKIKEMSSAPFPSSQHDSVILTQTQLKPQVITVVESHKIEETSTTPRPNSIPGFGSLFPMDLWEKRNNTNRPGLQQVVTQSIQTAGSLLFGSAQETAVQTVQGVLDESQVVVVDKDPEMQSVVVLKPTQKPGFFANVWGPGSFNIFNKITIYDSTTNKPMNSDNENLQSESSSSSNPDQPEESKVTEFLDNPQSDHSVTSSQDELTTITDDSNGNVAQLDQPSAAFDKLVDNLTESGNKTDSDEKGSLVVDASLLPNSQNKPLLVERPGQPPLLVERPIYVSEKPALSALFNFVRPSEDQLLLNVDHEVTKDIVYVFVKPESSTGLQAWFSIIKDDLIRNKENETAVAGMGNVEEGGTVDSSEEDPETIVEVSTEPGTVVEIVDTTTTTTEVPTVPEVVEVTEETIHAVSEVETSTETETISTGTIVQKTPEITTLPYPEEARTTAVEIVDTVTTEVPTVTEVTEVTGEIENSTETFVEETTTTMVENVDTVTTEVPTVPDVTEITVALEESTPEAEASETQETNSPVAQQLLNTTPEVTTILEAGETTGTTEIYAEVNDSETLETSTVTEQEFTEATEASTYPEVAEVGSTSRHEVSEVRRLKKREVSLPIIDKLLISLRENWTIPEDVDLFNEESELTPEPVFLEEPETTQPGFEGTTTEAPETFTMSGVVEIEFSQNTDPEDVEVAEEKKESVPEFDASEEPETTTMTAEEIDTTTPEVSSIPEAPTTLVDEIVDTAPKTRFTFEVVRATANGTEIVVEVENSESAINRLVQEAASEVSEENNDSMEKHNIQTTAVPPVRRDVEPIEEKTESIPQIRVSTTPRTTPNLTAISKAISAEIEERVRILEEYERNHPPVLVQRDEDKAPVVPSPEYMLAAAEIVAHYTNMKIPVRPVVQKPYVKLPKGLESIEAVREYERTHDFIRGFRMAERPKETTAVVKEVETTTQSVQTVPKEVGVFPAPIETHVAETAEFPMAPETIIVPEADEHPGTSTSTIVNNDAVETIEIPSEPQVNVREEQETSPTVVEKIVNHWTIGTLQ